VYLIALQPLGVTFPFDGLIIGVQNTKTIAESETFYSFDLLFLAAV
jgi:hypothetical protein